MKYLFLLIIILISSCIIDEVYTFKYKILNNSEHDLSLIVFDQKEPDTITIPVNNFFAKEITEDNHFSLFQSADSIIVNFDDNKNLVYYFDDYCVHGKNLFCPDSFNCEQLDENNERCQFTFTEDDYLKAM